MRPTARHTIVAVSSPLPDALTSPGDGMAIGRAILRLSGARALQLAELVFRCGASIPSAHAGQTPAPQALGTVRGWRRVSGAVSWRGHSLAAHAYVMRSPHSYTREDIVELHVPALPWLLEALLEELLTAGARLAEPGEFTRRAFENGRIKLDQAEAVGALIASRSAGEARMHASRLRAHAHEWRAGLRREIEDLLALVELGLDFSHDEAGVLSAAQLCARLEGLRTRLAELPGPAARESADAADESAILTAGLPRVLLLGPTNAGKSSLFNVLLGRLAAIVSPHPHTTRDTVEATLSFPGAGTALLIDSAGCPPLGAPRSAFNIPHPEAGTNLLRQAAWAATLSAARAADVVLLLMDRSVPVPEQEELGAIAPALAQAKPDALALLWSKVDLPPAPGWCAARDCGLRIADCRLDFGISGKSGLNPLSEIHNPKSEIERGVALPVAACFEVSSVDGRGIPALREFLAAKVAEAGAQPKDAYLAAAAAARAAAQSAAEALSRASDALARGHGEDVVAVELREALHAFWQAEGVLLKHDAVTEATLDRIFSRFCVGK